MSIDLNVFWISEHTEGKRAWIAGIYAIVPPEPSAGARRDPIQTLCAPVAMEGVRGDPRKACGVCGGDPGYEFPV